MLHVMRIWIALVLLTSLSSCLFMGPSIKGNGNVREEERRVGSFNEVKVTSGMNVHFLQGTEPSVVVVADENLMKVIETKVVDETLEIRALANIWSASSRKVVVTVSRLRGIQATAGSNIYTDNQLTAGQFELRASAGSNFHVDIDAGLIDVSVSSGANVNLSGRSAELIAKTSSGGNLKAEDFRADVSDVRVSSGSNAWVTARQELTAHASSGGNIFYYGTPQTASVSTSSGGNIHKR